MFVDKFVNGSERTLILGSAGLWEVGTYFLYATCAEICLFDAFMMLLRKVFSPLYTPVGGGRVTSRSCRWLVNPGRVQYVCSG